MHDHTKRTKEAYYEKRIGSRTPFKIDFEARSSEKLVGKAGGKKGSEAY